MAKDMRREGGRAQFSRTLRVFGAAALAGFAVFAAAPDAHAQEHTQVVAALIATPPAAPAAAAPAAAAPAAAAAPVPVENPAVAALRARVAGTWREVSNASNTASRDAGVARTVDALFFMIRPIASSRLTEANPAFPSVRIALQDGQIEVQTGAVSARSPEGGAERTVRGLDGETNRLVQTLTSNALVQTTWTEAGSRTTRFVPSADGRHLTLHIQIRSPRLSVPVRYTMSYTRVDG